MNDWSECGTRLQLLSDYHIENGATISLVILTDGIRITLSWQQWHGQLVDYINVPTPDKTTVKQLELIIHTSVELIYVNSSGHFDGIKFHEDGCDDEFHALSFEPLGPRCHPDQLISSLEWLKNNYRLRC